MTRTLSPKVLAAVGKQFHRWTVLALSPAPVGLKYRQGTWCRVRCACGTERVRPLSQIVYGRTQSCGCLQKTLNVSRASLPSEEAARRRALMTCKASARTRGLEFRLTDQERLSLLAGNCNYCGGPPSRIARGGGRCHTSGIKVSGIDRRDSSKGYTPENCVSCCGLCNSMKLDLSEGEFYTHIRKIMEHST